MKNIRMSVLVLSVALVLVISTSPGQTSQSTDYKVLLGTWDVELIEMGMAMEFVFKMEGDALTGEMIFDMGGAQLEDIKFEEGSLSFNAVVDAGGQSIYIAATAKVADNEMTGVMSSDMGDVDFSGLKRK